jgi:hypothetical protein
VLVFYLANTVPSALMGIVTGAHGTGQSIGSMVSAGAAALATASSATMTYGGGAIKAVGSTGNALHGGATLASEQLRNATLNGTAPTGRLERHGAAAGAALVNAGLGALKDIGSRLSGRDAEPGTTMGARVGASLRSQAAEMREARETSSSSGGPDGGTIRGA